MIFDLFIYLGVLFLSIVGGYYLRKYYEKRKEEKEW